MREGDEVGELVDDNHDVRQETVSVVRVEPATGEFLIVFLDVTHSGVFHKVITVVHLDAE